MANFYLVCFLIGFLLSVLSFLLGSLHFNFHLGHAGIDGLHVHVGGAGHFGGHAGADAPHAGGGHGPAAEAETALSPLNFGTIAAFLTWFGASGYLLTRYASLWSVVAVGVSTVFGVAGAACVFTFLAKLSARDENLDPGDYEMVGVLGHISSGIRAGGTGEIIYSQEGTRRTCGARSEDGREMPKGIEVVVTRYEKGLAYVRRWDEMAGEK